MSKYDDIEHPRELRTRQGLTLTCVAEKMGSSQPNVSRFENGLDVVSTEYLDRYARAIAVPSRVVARFYWSEVEAQGWRLIKLAKGELSRTRPRTKKNLTGIS